MKNKSSTSRTTFLCALLSIILIGNNCYTHAQDGEVHTLTAAENEIQLPSGPCVSAAEHATIKARIKNYKTTMEANGQLATNRVSAFGSHSFRWPLAPAKHNHNLGFYYISNYVDLNPVSNGVSGSNTNHTLEDYNCGTRTYDVNNGGYDHSGIDIATGPFGWTMMDNNDVDVVAAEGGTISDRLDGEFDRTCRTGVANVYHGNYIAITHYDGSSTLYMHMKSGTVTNKIVGEYVSAGEYLGKVGSSGNSTGPHLHFEVHDDLGNVRDPFQNGNCNSGDNPSLWRNEEPYYNRQIVNISTLSAPWSDATCDTNGISHGYSGVVPYRNHFNPGDPVWVTASVRDITYLNPVSIKIYNSSGGLLSTYNYTEQSTYVKLRTLNPILFLAPSTTGNYKIQCTYNGVTRAHYFTVGCPGSITLASTRSSNYGYVSGGTITSTDVINASARNVQYQAETFIQLNTGFVATDGCEFLARIDNCTVGSTKLEEPSDVNEDAGIGVKIFPNPFAVNSEIELTALKDEKISIRIYDITGRMVKTIAEDMQLPQGVHQFSINGNELRQGMYQCTITNADGNKITERINIIK